MRLVFDKLEPDKLVGAFFLDRAAMKVPDIDANCDCMFTNPEEIQKVWFGGRWKAKGFGFAPKCRTLFQAEDFPACTWKAQGLHAGAGKHVTGKRVQGFIGTCWMMDIDEIQEPTLAILLVLTYFCLCSCLCFVSHYSRPVSTCLCARHVQ